jgi:hypothetical protein
VRSIGPALPLPAVTVTVSSPAAAGVPSPTTAEGVAHAAGGDASGEAVGLPTAGDAVRQGFPGVDGSADWVKDPAASTVIATRSSVPASDRAERVRRLGMDGVGMVSPLRVAGLEGGGVGSIIAVRGRPLRATFACSFPSSLVAIGHPRTGQATVIPTGLALSILTNASWLIRIMSGY